MNTLEILSPKSEIEVSDFVPTKSATAIYLEDLQVHLANCLNRHEWDHVDLKTYVAVNFQAFMQHMSEPIVTTRKAFIERYKNLCRTHPEYSYEVEHVNADVDDARGTAIVWYVLSIWGHPKGVERKSVSVNTWERNKGKWLCVKQTGIRGIGWGI